MSTRAPRRRRTGWWVLVLALVTVPLLEIWTILQVGRVVGPWWTIALMLVIGAIGSWLIKHEGGRAWSALRTALSSGRMPTAEIADGALILIGGTLMLSPGFFTDAVGVLLILPLTRPVARRLLARFVERRLVVAPGFPAPGFPGRESRGPDARRPGPPPDGPVVRGDVVD